MTRSLRRSEDVSAGLVDVENLPGCDDEMQFIIGQHLYAIAATLLEEEAEEQDELTTMLTTRK